MSTGTSACTEEPFGLIMDSEEQALHLRMRVEQLAGKIGERIIFRPTAP